GVLPPLRPHDARHALGRRGAAAAPVAEGRSAIPDGPPRRARVDASRAAPPGREGGRPNARQPDRRPEVLRSPGSGPEDSPRPGDTDPASSPFSSAAQVTNGRHLL